MGCDVNPFNVRRAAPAAPAARTWTDSPLDTRSLIAGAHNKQKLVALVVLVAAERRVRKNWTRRSREMMKTQQWLCRSSCLVRRARRVYSITMRHIRRPNATCIENTVRKASAARCTLRLTIGFRLGLQPGQSLYVTRNRPNDFLRSYQSAFCTAHVCERIGRL